MTLPIPILQVAAGGYGAVHLKAIRQLQDAGKVKLVGIVDPTVGVSVEGWESVPVYAEMEAAFAAVKPLLTTIASPIPLHSPQISVALKNGSHVFCEKPVCSSRQEIEMLKALSLESGRKVWIGFQSAYSAANQRLKREIAAGEFGKAQHFSALVEWPRPLSYFGRNNWAGKLRTHSGHWVLDSPLNNAASHFLFILLYLNGPAKHLAMQPLRLQAETWRVNDIETFDTVVFRAELPGGATLHYAASHSVGEVRPAKVSAQFETGSFQAIDGDHGLVVGRPNQPDENYGLMAADTRQELEIVLEHLISGSGEPELCGISAASAHTECTLAVHRSMPEPVRVPESAVKMSIYNDSTLRMIPGLQKVLNRCVAEKKLPSELGIYSWARAGEWVDLPVRDMESGDAV